MKTGKNLMLSLAATVLVGGCVTAAPERAYEVRQPKAQVARTFTSFSDSLRCMDDLFLKHGVKNIVITSTGIPDATGKVSGGEGDFFARDMLISAMSRMSVRSNAFVFVDFDQDQEDITQLQELVGFTDEFKVPSYYIRGAITQLDDNVLDESVGGALSATNFSIGAQKNQVVSVISTDLNLGKLATRQIIPGISANNSIVVRRSGVGGEIGATIQKVGLSFNIALNKQEGLHQATRTLIELSVIEITGKLTRVPYWRCLKIENTNPLVASETEEWYKSMSDQERVAFVQQALITSGDYKGPKTGTITRSTRSAIGRYQARNGLIADGRIDLDLYKSLIYKDLAAASLPAPATKQTAAAATKPLSVSVTTPKGPSPTYKVKEALAMTVTTSRDAFIYCYYSDANGSIARVFPNRFSPDPYVAGGKSTTIPGKNSRFGIVFDEPGAEEEVLCIASERELGRRLPDDLKKEALKPLPIESLDDVATEFRKVDPKSVKEARLSIRVAK